MSMKQEPIIFNFKPGGIRDDAPTLNKFPQVTLLINPETITIPWKKIITRVRTKSRIVSLYWGQEPLTLAYKGQTGNLYPNIELQKKLGESLNNSLKGDIAGLQQDLDAKDKEIEAKRTEYNSIGEYATYMRSAVMEELGVLYHDRDIIADSISQLGQTIDASGVSYTTLTDGMSHTEILRLSPKYQKFSTLRKLYEQSQTVSELMYVRYRDWLFEGYFENFSFTEDVKSPWNWTYNLTFTILNWDNFGDYGTIMDETVFVSDEYRQEYQSTEELSKVDWTT